MALAKTLTGRQALRERCPHLGMRERQILIMCDGKRSALDLARTVGTQAADSIATLMNLGYVAEVQNQSQDMLTRTGTFMVNGTNAKRERTSSPLRLVASDGVVSDFGVSTSSATLDALDALESNQSSRSQKTERSSMFYSQVSDFSGYEGDSQAPSDSTTSRAGAKKHKRSLAGAKMYMINVLQIVRHLEANVIITQMHKSPDRDALVDTMLYALDFIQDTSGEEYAERVFDQLHDMLPPAYLLKLHEHNVAPTIPQKLA